MVINLVSFIYFYCYESRFMENIEKVNLKTEVGKQFANINRYYHDRFALNNPDLRTSNIANTCSLNRLNAIKISR